MYSAPGHTVCVEPGNFDECESFGGKAVTAHLPLAAPASLVHTRTGGPHGAVDLLRHAATSSVVALIHFS